MVVHTAVCAGFVQSLGNVATETLLCSDEHPNDELRNSGESVLYYFHSFELRKLSICPYVVSSCIIVRGVCHGLDSCDRGEDNCVCCERQFFVKLFFFWGSR